MSYNKKIKSSIKIKNKNKKTSKTCAIYMDINTGEPIKEDERNLQLETIFLMEARDPLLVGFAKREANQILDQNMRSNIYTYMHG